MSHGLAYLSPRLLISPSGGGQEAEAGGGKGSSETPAATAAWSVESGSLAQAHG